MLIDEKLFIINCQFSPKNDVMWVNNRIDANNAGGTHENERFPIYVMVILGAT